MIERMISIRKNAKETHSALAKALGRNRAQIVKYEMKINKPGIEYLKDFCMHYGVSADYILGLPHGLDWPEDQE